MHRLLLLILAAVVSCSSVQPNSSPNLAEAVIRHELATSGSYLASNRAKTYFVLVEGRDISNDAIRRMVDTGLPLRPGSAWKLGAGMHMSINAPKARSDGDYDVAHSYYCGDHCAAWVTSVVRREGKLWIVISSTLDGISLFYDADSVQWSASGR